jgi:acetyl-CoA acetyltransferase
MSARFRGQNEVAIVGYAHSPVRRRADVPLGVLALETCNRAVEDAGLKNEQIDGFTTGSILPSAGGQDAIDGVSIVTANWIAQRMGGVPRWVCGFQGYGQVPGAVMLATEAITSGSADYVLVHRALSNPIGHYHENPMTEAVGSAQWTAPQGFWGPIGGIALTYNEYMQRYGATREDMANVVVELRKNGSRMPWSYWYEQPISVDDYMNARMICDPMSVLDCDIPVEGVAAFVFTSAERARELPNKPVYVAGFTQGHPTSNSVRWPLDEIMEVGRGVADRLWESTGLTVDDIDVPALYDGFSPFIYWWLEVLGYCKPGEAHELVRDGGIDADRGGIAAATHGGALGNGRMHGIPQMLETYLQLSRRAGDRQLAKADIGLACHSSPHWGGAVMYSAEPL